jgi:hypothetical protein
MNPKALPTVTLDVSIRDRLLPGIRENAPKRNALVVVLYLLGGVVTAQLLLWLVGLLF